MRSQASFEADQNDVRRFNLEQLQPNEVFELLLDRQRSGESDKVKQSLRDAFEIVRHAEEGALEAHIPKALSTHDDKEVQA